MKRFANSRRLGFFTRLLDDVTPAERYRLAAEQNLDVAETNLGSMYDKGCGVEQNLTEAVRWYRKAAAQGNDNAIKALKCLGIDVP